MRISKGITAESYYILETLKFLSLYSMMDGQNLLPYPDGVHNFKNENVMK